MGLDMYLQKETYIGAKYAHRKEEIEGFQVSFPQALIQRDRVTEVVEEVAYWRKANAIHKWFVDNVQEGVDEWQRSEVSKDQLKELKDLCERALKDKNPELLPPCEGFLFGGTEIDEWYWEDLKYTVEVLGGVLNELEALKYPDYNVTFYYKSSW